MTVVLELPERGDRKTLYLFFFTFGVSCSVFLLVLLFFPYTILYVHLSSLSRSLSLSFPFRLFSLPLHYLLPNHMSLYSPQAFLLIFPPGFFSPKDPPLACLLTSFLSCFFLSLGSPCSISSPFFSPCLLYLSFR